MKKKLQILLIISGIFLAPGLVFSQSKNTRNTDQVNYTLPQDRSFAHWSYGISVGGNFFDGDVAESAKKMIPSSELDLTLGANIEYSFNPVFGVGIQYVYIPYGASPDDVRYDLDGKAHELDAFLSINLLNLFYKSRGQRWGLYFNVGMGLSYYNATMRYKNSDKIYSDTHSKGEPMDLKDGWSYTWPLGLTLEYNIFKYMAVGLKAEYRMHAKDNYEGYKENVRRGNSNDAFALLSITLRHKLHFGKDYHVRNLSYGDPSVTSFNAQLADMERRIQNRADSCCLNALERLAIAERELEQKMDAVIAAEEIERLVAERIIADQVLTEALLIDGMITLDENAKKAFNAALRGIQFETAKATIKPESYQILDNVVGIMKENPKFDLDIIGHTDNVGNETSNLDLSERRANSVRQYMMEKGVSGTRLTASGKGLYEPIATNTTASGRALNRRVEFVVKYGNEVIYKTDKQ